jgi:hypothetical protein
MKKIKLGKKLNLNKKTISNLKSDEMKKVNGGGTNHTCESVCIFCYLTHEYFTCGGC